MNKKTVRDIDVKDKLVLVRVDYNVPIKDGKVGDDLRIKASFETINYLLKQNCRLVLMSHLGRPEGKPDPQYSLELVAKKAGELLGRDIKFVGDCVGPEAEKAVGALKPGDILLLENTRFHPEEEANDPEFAKKLAKFGEVYVYDAFASYRPHASTEGVAHVLPGVAGLLVEKEIDTITGAVQAPNRPFVAVLGGAKVSTKLDILSNLIPKVDAMMLTGPIANTFALAMGYKIGQSVAEPERLDDVRGLIELAKREDTELLVPEEVLVSRSLEKPEKVRTVSILGSVEDGEYIVDATPAYAERLKSAIYDFLDFDGKSTILWNGPLGITEIPEFTAGSRAMAKAIIETKGTSIVGGGDTAAFIDAEGLHDKFTWVSTGGGASLEVMSGKPMPCVDALQDR